MDEEGNGCGFLIVWIGFMWLGTGTSGRIL
jgi:hypothetical protein